MHEHRPLSLAESYGYNLAWRNANSKIKEADEAAQAINAGLYSEHVKAEMMSRAECCRNVIDLFEYISRHT